MPVERSLVPAVYVAIPAQVGRADSTSSSKCCRRVFTRRDVVPGWAGRSRLTERLNTQSVSTERTTKLNRSGAQRIPMAVRMPYYYPQGPKMSKLLFS